jgi:hypothetical protein
MMIWGDKNLKLEERKKNVEHVRWLTIHKPYTFKISVLRGTMNVCSVYAAIQNQIVNVRFLLSALISHSTTNHCWGLMSVRQSCFVMTRYKRHNWTLADNERKACRR